MITPQPGYIVDPNNPNGVMKDPNYQAPSSAVPPTSVSSASPAPAASSSTTLASPAITPPSPTGLSDSSFIASLNGMQQGFNQNNDLLKQRSALLQQLYTGPGTLTPQQLSALPPDMQQLIQSGNIPLQQVQLQAINDSLAGRQNSLANSISYLTTGYQQAEKAQQDAYTTVLNYSKATGSKPSSIIKALYPSLVAQMPESQLQNMDSIAAAWIPGTASVVPNVGVGGYDLTSYATDPNYSTTISSIASKMGEITDAGSAQTYISNISPNSPISGDMVMNAASQYGVDPTVLMAQIQQESHFGTSSVATNNNNVTGITWSGSDNMKQAGATKGSARPASEGGNYAKFPTIQDSINYTAQWLAKHQVQEPAAPLMTNPHLDSSVNANQPVPSIGGRSLNDVWINAVTLALDKTYSVQKPVGGLSGGKQQIQDYKSKIENTKSALIANAEVDQPLLQSQFAANTKALGQVVPFMNNVDRALSAAENSGALTQKLFADKGINPSDSTWANKTLNDLNKQFGSSGDIRAYQSAMTEVGNDYAIVFARGGQRSVEGNKIATDLTNGNVKLSDIQKSLDTLQQIGQVTLQTSVDQVKKISSGTGTDQVAKFLAYIHGVKDTGAPADNSDLSTMSDADLQKIANGQ